MDNQRAKEIISELSRPAEEQLRQKSPETLTEQVVVDLYEQGQEQTKTLRSIQNWMTFFGTLAIVGLAVFLLIIQPNIPRNDANRLAKNYIDT